MVVWPLFNGFSYENRVQWGLSAALGTPRGTRSNMLETRNMRKNNWLYPVVVP